MTRVARDVLLFAEMELRRILRTSQLWTHMVAPVVGVPGVLLLLVVQLLSAPAALEWVLPTTRVAVDAEAPPELELTHHFDRPRLELVATEDAQAAFERDEVDAALVGWTPGDGLGTRVDESLGPFRDPPRRPEAWSATSWRWRVTVLAQDEDDQERVEGVLADAGDAWLEDQLAVHALDPSRIRRPWAVHAIAPEGPAKRSEDPHSRSSFLIMIGVASGILLGQLLGVLPLSDRRDGVTETWQTLGVSPFAVLGGRMLAASALTWLLMQLAIVLAMSSVADPETFQPYELLSLPICCTLVVAAATVPVGLYSPSVTLASNVIVVSWAVAGPIVYGLSTQSPLVQVVCSLALFFGSALGFARLGTLGRTVTAEAES